MEEIWEEIDCFDGFYFVSNFGRVKSIKFGRERYLKPFKKIHGSLHVCLALNGEFTVFKLARLVGFYFVKNDKNYPYIKHIDKDKNNNRFDNLYWSKKT